MKNSSTNSRSAGLAADVMVRLERNSGEPLHRQIEASLRDAIRSGRLAIGTSLPPTRAVAADLGVSRGVVVEAYQQLTAEGYLSSRSGGYTQVSAGAEPTAPPRVHETSQRVRVNFGYGRADLTAFPRAAWLRSVRRVFAEAPNDRFDYPGGHGVPELRSALADYLNRVRGTAADPANMMVCTGYGQGIHLIMRVLARRGARRIAIEDPSLHDQIRPLTDELSIEQVPVPVGERGIEVAALEDSRADAVILTPSHQWPTGSVISAESRGAIIAWARRTNALVIEDDYDAEYRYDRSPIGAMQGLAPEHVLYMGSASKTLAPGLRLGWMVLPRQFVDDMVAAKVFADHGSPVIDQLTFADFLARGEFDRHLRRMRPIYRSRRDALLSALSAKAPGLEPAGIAAGLHLITWLPDEVDEQHIVSEANDRGVAIAGVSAYRFAPSGRQGLIFGYSNLDERTIGAGIDILADIIGSTR